MNDIEVRQSMFEPDYDVVPQAIFWRPLRYFTMCIRQGEDELDLFQAASFTIGNEVKFDLRVYRGHPELTVTLYLPDNVSDEKVIADTIDLVVRGMVIPLAAVAWRRGQRFEYGRLERPKADNRLREHEARIIVLKIAAQQPGRSASTSLLKREVPKYIELSAKDRVRSQSRPREFLWQQVVGNVVSHQKSSEGPFAKGLAVRTADGLKVTKEGLDYLNDMGFKTSP
ncbi:MAG TPA: hypothetical protein VME47_13535 [Acetobacteraceae bacterium]|nr:hypothetical protein [Acetobacteraceae bacterium]